MFLRGNKSRAELPPVTPALEPLRRIAAYAVARDDEGRVLLVRASSKSGTPGVWSLPGGAVDHGEDPNHTVVRETAEETGLVVRVRALAGEVVRPGIGAGAYRIRDYLVDIVAGEEKPGDDAADVDWVPLERLPDLDLTSGLADTLRRWSVLP